MTETSRFSCVNAAVPVALLLTLAGCADERLIVAMDVSVSRDLLEQVTGPGRAVGIVHLMDGATVGTMGVVCREAGHPLREDGLYHRSLDVVLGGWSDDPNLKEVTDEWETHSVDSNQACDIEALELGAELWSIEGSLSCDDLAGADELPSEGLEDLIASTALEVPADEGECQEVARRVGPSSTNMASDPTSPDPVRLELGAEEVVDP